MSGGTFRTFTRWSWSQLLTYRECPFRARLKYLEHEPEPPRDANAANERGSRVHDAAENFVLHDGEITPELMAFEGLLTDVRAAYVEQTATVEAEKPHYFDANWQPTTKEGRWLTFVPDLKVTGPVNLTVDYKTGKKYGNEVKHYGQVELYCVCSWIEDPGYDEYFAELWYIDQKDVVPHVFTAAHLERARARIDLEVSHMMHDKIHQPRPNRFTCKWCPYSPRGTGVCPVGV